MLGLKLNHVSKVKVAAAGTTMIKILSVIVGRHFPVNYLGYDLTKHRMFFEMTGDVFRRFYC